jgi:hypothetical protein
MGLTNVDLDRIDGNSGTLANVNTVSLNGGPLSGARNRIINGDMRIDQRNAGASVSVGAGSSSLYILDRFFAQNINGTTTFTVQRSTLSPALFTNSTLITTATNGSPTAADSNTFCQYIEGFNVADLGWGTLSAQTITLSFWVRSSITGSFGVGLANNDATRSYAASYSITAANTWEYKTIVVPGDTTGTWATNETTGIRLAFNIGSGSDWHQSINAWGANGGGRGAFSGVTSLLATAGATFYITGVQLEAGTVATPFERRSYGQELSLCQRYYQTIQPTVYVTAPGSATLYLPVTWQTMRDTPVAATVSQSLYSNTISVTLVPEGASGGRLNTALSASGYGGASGTYSLAKEL